MARAYDMTKRSRSAEETAERIAASTEELLGSEPLADITLQRIAQGSGVTVQTVLRHMGSRDGCFAAAGRRISTRVEAQRGRTPPGDVAAAIGSLVSHYEAEGRSVLGLLAQESSEPIAQQASAAGRSYHRAWVLRCFGPLLPDPDDRTTIDALVAATDLYVWKLLRLDLGRSAPATEATMSYLVHAVLEDQ